MSNYHKILIIILKLKSLLTQVFFAIVLKRAFLSEELFLSVEQKSPNQFIHYRLALQSQQ